mmetsp:Transcript_15024/g.44638  ORF Transcript_15024/g.44638 Transcript_15024/m.44638 type:complete len:448 (-) Transcript_15024:173-1516(-)
MMASAFRRGVLCASQQLVRPLRTIQPAVAAAQSADDNGAARLGAKILGVGIAGLGAAVGLHTSTAQCHGSDAGRLSRLEEQVANLTAQLGAQFDVQTTTGQGDAVFEWDVELTKAFPDAAKPFEKDLHGGFNEDPDTGVVYTGIPGYGLCSISPDLKSWKKIGSDPRLQDNCHGIVVFKHKGATQIAVAQNEHQRILIVDLDGKVKQELPKPKGGEFEYDEANWYYSHAPKKQCPWGTPHNAVFAVTDVTYHDGKLYAVAGYCDGDFVVTATENDGNWEWGPLAWGGRGDEPGRFQTAHGIFAYDNHIFVANREAHQVIEFTPEGKLVRCLPDIPDTARICNVARADEYFVFNALEPIQHTPAKTASIYAHSGERLLSTIQPGELGIPVLKHLHHVWPHYVVDPKTKKRTLYLLVQGWSRGKFAVLKHVPGGKPSVPNGWNRTQEPL